MWEFIYHFQKGTCVMPTRIVSAVVLMTLCGVAARADEAVTIELYCASEHVPDGLKAGVRIDLMQVVGKTVTGGGKVSYSMTGVVGDVAVVSVKSVQKPKTPEQAVKVELRVTKAQAAVIEKAKVRLVNVTVATSDGDVKTERRTIPFRLELIKPKKD